jgi:hypothetical protein
MADLCYEIDMAGGVPIIRGMGRLKRGRPEMKNDIVNIVLAAAAVVIDGGNRLFNIIILCSIHPFQYSAHWGTDKCSGVLKMPRAKSLLHPLLLADRPG